MYIYNINQQYKWYSEWVYELHYNNGNKLVGTLKQVKK